MVNHLAGEPLHQPVPADSDLGADRQGHTCYPTRMSAVTANQTSCPAPPAAAIVSPTATLRRNRRVSLASVSTILRRCTIGQCSPHRLSTSLSRVTSESPLPSNRMWAMPSSLPPIISTLLSSESIFWPSTPRCPVSTMRPHPLARDFVPRPWADSWHLLQHPGRGVSVTHQRVQPAHNRVPVLCRVGQLPHVTRAAVRLHAGHA